MQHKQTHTYMCVHTFVCIVPYAFQRLGERDAASIRCKKQREREREREKEGDRERERKRETLWKLSEEIGDDIHRVR